MTMPPSRIMLIGPRRITMLHNRRPRFGLPTRIIMNSRYCSMGVLSRHPTRITLDNMLAPHKSAIPIRSIRAQVAISHDHLTVPNDGRQGRVLVSALIDDDDRLAGCDVDDLFSGLIARGDDSVGVLVLYGPVVRVGVV